MHKKISDEDENLVSGNVSGKRSNTYFHTYRQIVESHFKPNIPYIDDEHRLLPFEDTLDIGGARPDGPSLAEYTSSQYFLTISISIT